MAKKDDDGSSDEQALQRILRFQTEAHEQGKLIELNNTRGLIICVRRGRVLATTVDQEGRETLCVLRESGAVLGLESIVGMALPYFLWTLSEVELSIAPASQAREWLSAHGSQPASALLRSTLHALRLSLSERIALHGSATARLARLLLSAVEGEGGERGPAGVMLTLPKNVLARMLQMRPETLSRVLRKLEESGAVKLEPQLRVMDRERLIALKVNDRGND
jgi:CRP-like cAMP-binding protein